ncbi:hypothetical protein IEQ34_012061 [Dendrobium chrysotoxum]|uniref:Uncharacterized protein n=1 Tax=Dendrobium chrysotoxum TaxID=161865 RepID=A0AAV7GSW7_DENCH|nr:hypothetical protein IEQ34_012061 [Dendrobium chrysotoxum]
MDGYVKLIRFFLVAMACFLCVGLLLSFAVESSGPVPPPPFAPVMSGEGQMSNGRITMELFHVSKRRVPNGPDPIHNRHPQYEKQQQEEEQFKEGQHLFISVFALEEDPPSPADGDIESSSVDNLFGDIDHAISLKRQEFVKQGLLPPNPLKNKNNASPVDSIDELLPEEVIDLEEFEEFHGLTVISNDEIQEENPVKMPEKVAAALSDSPSFELDHESLGKRMSHILEPKFSMTLAELLDDSRVVPLPVYGNLEVLITELQHDHKEVCFGDLFICCPGATTDGHDYLTEADKRGVVVVVANKVTNLNETLACKALVVVEDTNLVLPVIAASFYRNPSSTLPVIGITGTRGKTSTSYLVKAMYEAVGLRTGMLGSLGHYIYGDNKLEASESTPDAVIIQKLMAKMIHNGEDGQTGCGEPTQRWGARDENSVEEWHSSYEKSNTILFGRDNLLKVVATNIENKIFDPGGSLSSFGQRASMELRPFDARGE